MTVGLAFPWRKHIILGVDSLCTAGSTCEGLVQKYARIGDGLAIGAGGLGPIQAMIRLAIESEVTCAEDFSQIAFALSEAEETEWIWADASGLYGIDGAGACVQYETSISIGSGGPFALGHLAGQAKPRSMKQAHATALAALAGTGEAYLDCGGPYHVFAIEREAC